MQNDACLKCDKIMTTKQVYDYIVVGSGPGGATVAKELAEAKKKVLIVEYGPRFTDKGEIKVINKLFLDKEKKLLRSDGGIYIGQTRILGGTSYVAMGGAVTPPDSILKEWKINLSKELESAREDLRVKLMPSHLIGEGTQRIIEGARSLGWEMKPTPKCVDFDKCTGCGICMYGCPTGAKWTSLEFVDKAIENGADLLLNSEVRKVLHENGKTVGVSFTNNGSTSKVYGKNIILSAGAIETPKILQNSGVEEAGKGIALDVFQSTFGYTEDVGMKNEPVMAVYLDKFIEDKGLFPSPYMYPTLTLVRNMLDFEPKKYSGLNQLRALVKTRKVKAKRLIGMMTKIRDEITGEVRTDGTIKKALTKKDQESLDEAHEINKKILLASRAKSETITRGVYESGHPCCTAPIGKVVDENQETEISNLFVSDASVFPSPLGMPPILTIVALSKKLSNYLLANT